MCAIIGTVMEQIRTCLNLMKVQQEVSVEEGKEEWPLAFISLSFFLSFFIRGRLGGPEFRG